MQNCLRFFVLGRRRRSNIRVSFTCRQRGCECGWGKLMRMSCSYRSQLLIIAFAYYFPFIAHVARLDMPSLGGGGRKAETLKPFIFCTLLWHFFLYPPPPPSTSFFFICLDCHFYFCEMFIKWRFASGSRSSHIEERRASPKELKVKRLWWEKIIPK